MRMTKLATLKVVPVNHGAIPRPNVVAQIESLLARAKSGELQSIVACWIRSNGKPATAQAWGNGDTDYFTMGTALLMAERNFTEDLIVAEIGPPTPTEKDEP